MNNCEKIFQKFLEGKSLTPQELTLLQKEKRYHQLYKLWNEIQHIHDEKGPSELTDQRILNYAKKSSVVNQPKRILYWTSWEVILKVAAVFVLAIIVVYSMIVLLTPQSTPSSIVVHPIPSNQSIGSNSKLTEHRIASYSHSSVVSPKNTPPINPPLPSSSHSKVGWDYLPFEETLDLELLKIATHLDREMESIRYGELMANF